MEFEDFKIYKLNEILINKSSDLKINDLKDNNGKYPLYGVSGFLKNISFCQEKQKYIGIVKDGSVGNLFLCKENSSVINTMEYLIPKNNFNIYYIYFLLKTINFNKYKVGSVIPHLYFKDYSIEKVKIPKWNTQIKIGNFLNNVNKHINLLKWKIRIFKKFKLSLLQKMFV